MSNNDHDNLINDTDFSLEAILAEYQSEENAGVYDAPPRTPVEERSRGIVMEAISETIRTAKIAEPEEAPEPVEKPRRRLNIRPEAAGPEPPEDSPAEPTEPEPVEKPRRRLNIKILNPKAAGLEPAEDSPAEPTEPEADIFEEEAPAPDFDAGDSDSSAVPFSYVRQMVDTDEKDAYAGADYPRPQPEREPEEKPRRKPGRDISELLLAPVISVLAMVAARRQAQAGKKPKTETDENAPEIQPAKAAKLYSSQTKPLKFRAIVAFALCVVLVYISYAYGTKLPLLGALGGTRAAAVMCLLLQLAVMLAGLDVLTAGIMSLIRRTPGMEALAAVSCILSLADAVYIAIQGAEASCLPYCAVSSLSLAFALLGSRMYCDGLRMSLKTAVLTKNPYILTAEDNVCEGEPGIVKSRTALRGFVRRCEEPDMAEMAYSTLSPFLLIASIVLAALASLKGKTSFFHALSALVAISASFAAFLSFPLPFSITAKRIMSSGAAIAGCSGCESLGRSGRLVITDTDLFPAGTLAIENIRILEGTFTDKVISYTGSVIACSGGGLGPVFTELMSRNGCVMHHVENFSVQEGGGLTGVIRGEPVMAGTSGFMQLMGIRLPQRLVGSTAVFTAIGGDLVGVFNLKYTATGSVQDALVSLLHGRSQPVFAIRDFNITPLLIRQRFKMPTDGFDFPAFDKRYEISAVEPDENSEVAAVLSREGLGPMVEAAENGRRLFRASRICTALSLLGSCLGMILMFFLFFTGAADAYTVANMLSFMLLWLLPVVVVTLGLRR